MSSHPHPALSGSPSHRRARPLLLAALVFVTACDLDEPFVGLVSPPPSFEAPEYEDDPIQLATDFGGDVPGQSPAGWTTGWVSQGSNWHVDEREGRKVLVDNAASDGRRILVWEDAGEIFNPDVLMLTKVPGTMNSAQQWIVVRASGGAGEETGVAFQIRNNGFRIARYNNGSLLTVDGNPSLPIAPDPTKWYWVRLQVEDQLFRGKVWPEDEDEPDSWGIVRWNPDIMVPGHIGVGRFNSGTGDALFAYFGVGAGGLPPPRP